MTLLAVIGDCTTTTCLALAAGWPPADEVVVVEADPSGGSLTGWLDTPSSPSLATIVANTAGHLAATGDTVRSMIQHSASGVRFIAAPIRSSPAFRAIDEAAAAVIPWLAGSDSVVLADVGRHDGAERLPVALVAATAILAVHRQESASSAAAAVRLERLVEMIEQLATTGTPIVLAVIGADPFEPADVARFVDESSTGSVARFLTLADDPLSAAVLAGRSGVSAKRLRRLPLMRTAADAAVALRPFAVDAADQVDRTSTR